MNRFRAEDYTYRVFWSDEDEAWIAVADEFRSLSYIDEKSPCAALEGMVGLLRETLNDIYTDGKEPPMPFSKRKYSGSFALRMTPEQHRRIAIEAAEMGISMNQLLVSRI